MTHTFDALTVEKAAEACVLSRSKGRFMSMAQAIRAIRTLMPDWQPTMSWSDCWRKHAMCTACQSRVM